MRMVLRKIPGARQRAILNPTHITQSMQAIPSFCPCIAEPNPFPKARPLWISGNRKAMSFIKTEDPPPVQYSHLKNCLVTLALKWQSARAICVFTLGRRWFSSQWLRLFRGGAKVKRRLRPAAEAKWSFKPRLACHIHLPYVCVEGGDCKYEKHIESVVCNWHTVSWGLLLFELHICVCVYV